MHKHTRYKELSDPFAHYTRGVLYYDDGHFTFVAHRVPYLELDSKSWDTEQAFNADYQRLVARKYAYCKGFFADLDTLLK